MTPNRAIFRDRLRQARKMKGISQARLAVMVGVDRSTVVRWENESSGEIPQTTTLGPLAAALGVSAGWLIGFRDLPDAPMWPTPAQKRLLELAEGYGDGGIESVIRMLEQANESLARFRLRSKT
jgi:transcriptional regulator with XRE-family HTH domain